MEDQLARFMRWCSQFRDFPSAWIAYWEEEFREFESDINKKKEQPENRDPEEWVW